MASMTHELLTPLNAITGFTSQLDTHSNPDERAEYVRIIRNSTDMLQRLINDLIEATSMDEGSMAIEPVNTNFASAFEDICLLLEQRTQGTGLSFIKDNPFNPATRISGACGFGTSGGKPRVASAAGGFPG